RGNLRPTDTVLLALLMVMAAVAQLWPVHLSVKMKITVDDPATFAAALLLGPFYAMVAAGATTLIALHFRGVRQSWYNRGFNAATSALSTGAAATAFLLIAGSGAQVVREPWAIGIAAIAKYLVHSALVDLVVALQVRRNPIGGWWTLRRRLMPYAVARLVPGAPETGPSDGGGTKGNATAHRDRSPSPAAPPRVLGGCGACAFASRAPRRRRLPARPARRRAPGRGLRYFGGRYVRRHDDRPA